MKLIDSYEEGSYIGDEFIFRLWARAIFRGKKTKYEVSELGEIRKIKDKKNLKLHHTRKGYIEVHIKFNNVRYAVRLDRLIADTFIENFDPINRNEINHIDGNKENNCVGNLEWCSCLDSIKHETKTGLRPKRYGQDSNASTHSNEQIHQVCKLLEEGKLTNVEISKLTGINVNTISNIKCGSTWKEISDQYNIKKSSQNAKGIDAAASKYSEEQIHKVCKLLEDPNNAYIDIANETGVNLNAVYRICIKQNWTCISDQYDIKPRNSHKKKTKRK